MHIHMHIHMHIRMRIGIYTCTFTQTFAHTYLYMRTYTFVNIHILIQNTYTHAYAHVNTSVPKIVEHPSCILLTAAQDFEPPSVGMEYMELHLIHSSPPTTYPPRALLKMRGPFFFVQTTGLVPLMMEILHEPIYEKAGFLAEQHTLDDARFAPSTVLCAIALSLPCFGAVRSMGAEFL